MDGVVPRTVDFSVGACWCKSIVLSIDSREFVCCASMMCTTSRTNVYQHTAWDVSLFSSFGYPYFFIVWSIVAAVNGLGCTKSSSVLMF